MNPDKIFLTADWNYLLFFNYAVPEEKLKPFLPKGCELSLWQNQAYISIVAFQFNNTRVFKIKWPGFTHFLEINLRFYLDYKGKRSVCFIREYVPSRIIASVAKTIYNEPYKARKIITDLQKTQDKLSVEYRMSVKNHPFTVRAVADNQAYVPDKHSAEMFFTAHDFGIGKTAKGKTLFYKVKHPQWRLFPVKDYLIEIDWNFFFGTSFAFLANKKPNSVFLAEGSAITVYKHYINSLVK